MDSFEALDRDYNFPGLTLIQFLPRDNVASIPEATDLVIDLPITLTGVSSFFSMYATEDSMKLSYPQQNVEHGAMYQIKVTAFIPKLKENNDLNFDALKNQQLILLCTDGNGKIRLCGTVESAMSFSIEANTGEKSGDRNGAWVTFVGESDHVPYYYET
jgi:hypothetical protein